MMPWTGRRRGGNGDVHTLVGPYVLDAVSETERVAVERHLASCESCAAEVAELRATVARLGDAVSAPPPAAMRDRVLAAAGRTRQDGPPDRTDRGAGAVRSGWLRWPMAAALAALLVFGGGAAGYLNQQGRLDAARHRAATEHRRAVLGDQLATVLAAPDARYRSATLPGGGRAGIALAPGEDHAVVVLAGLPATPAGHTYELWMVRSGGAPVQVGMLPAGVHDAVRPIPDLPGADTFALSIEPAGGSPAPTHLYGGVPLA